MQRQDEKLTEHFTLFELTPTANAALQAANRFLSDEQMDKAHKLADYMERIRCLLNSPLHIHSGYRCDAVNGSTVGASSTSQHPKFEACDFDAVGQDVEDTFNTLYSIVRAGKLNFGQLIVEAANRGYKNPDGTQSISRWVHISMVGSLNPAHVGQVMRANWNAKTKKFDYVLLGVIRAQPINLI